MACNNLACVGTGGCIEVFPNGTADQVLVMNAGGTAPTWTTSALAGVSEKTNFGTRAGNAPLAPGSPVAPPAAPTAGDNYIETYDDKVLLWEYNGATWTLQSTIPITDLSEKTTFSTETGNAPAIPAAPVTPPASPVADDNHIETYDDKLLFWEYSGAAWVLQTETPIATVEKTTFTTTAGNAPAAPGSPVVPPASPNTGDNHIETYSDYVLFWEYNGATWTLHTTLPKTRLYRVVFTLGGDAHELLAGETATYRIPDAVTLVGIQGSLSTAGLGIVTYTLSINGANALTTNLTLDSGEDTSTTAATPAVLGITAIPADAKVVITCTTAGAGNFGATVTLLCVA